MTLCARCLDRMYVQDAYEDRLVEIHARAEVGALDEAFAILDQIWAAQGARDHEGWLERSIWSTRAFLLDQAGRLEDAFEAYRIRAELGFADASDEMAYRLGRADVLARLERRSEALADLEAALETVDEKTLPGALSVLARCVEVAGADAESLLQRHESLLRATLSAWGRIPSLPPKAGDAAPLVSQLSAAQQALKEAQARYAALKQELAATQSLEERTALIERFLASERVDFYRKLAASMLVPRH